MPPPSQITTTFPKDPQYTFSSAQRFPIENRDILGETQVRDISLVCAHVTEQAAQGGFGLVLEFTRQLSEQQIYNLFIFDQSLVINHC